jgi:trans-aconitate methyltransferase
MDLRSLWSERSQAAGLRAVLDPGDARGIKNRYIDYTQKRALAVALAAAGSTSQGAVLDFGCGVGRLSGWLAEQTGLPVIGYDAEIGMTRQAVAAHPALEFVSDLAACSGRLGAFFSVWVLQHVIADAELTALFERLTRESPIAWLVLYEKTASRSHADQTQGVEYQRVRTIADYESALRPCGFRLESVRFNNVRQQGVALHYVVPRLKHHGTTALFPALYALDRLATHLRRGQLDSLAERDTCMLFRRQP